MTTNLKYQLQHRIINLNYQIGHILYQVFKITLKNNGKIDNPSVRIYVIENGITFKTKKGLP